MKCDQNKIVAAKEKCVLKGHVELYVVRKGDKMCVCL